MSQRLTLPSRDSSLGRSQIQLNPSKLTPAPEIYLGQLASSSLAIADSLMFAANKAPTRALKNELNTLADYFIVREKTCAALLRKAGIDSSSLHEQFDDRYAELFELTKGVSFIEEVARLYVLVGIMEDSALRLSRGLSPAKRIQIEPVLLLSDLEQSCQKILQNLLANSPDMIDPLALYCRSVVADGLLEIRHSVDLAKLGKIIQAVSKADIAREEFKLLEPFTAELISAHNLRMDSLGLTA